MKIVNILGWEEELNWEPIILNNDYVLTIAEFLENVKDGFFIDNDGFGKLAASGLKSNIIIFPSNAEETLSKHKNVNATHIVWYNK